MTRILVEREEPLAALRAALDDARAGRGAVALVSGPPGIGKTSVLVEALGDTAGLTVLRGRGHELEQPFPFGLAVQLLGCTVDTATPSERARLLAGAAAMAEPIVSIHAFAAPAATADEAGVLHGLHWLVANLAERGPLALVIDDAHWADEPSLRWLAHLGERLADLPVALLLASRDEALGRRAPLAALRAAAARHVALEPLSEAGVHTVAGAGLDLAFTTACAEVTGGNPFLLRELLDELQRRELPPTPAAARAASPERVNRRMESRLAELGADARACASALAVLEVADRERIAALAGLPRTAAGAALDALARAGIVTASGAPLFVHPLLRAAADAGLGATSAARLHARAADLLEAAGEPSERVAEHVLCSGGGSARDVVRLRRAATEASERAAPAEAARLLRHALTLPGAPRGCAEEVALLADLGRAATTAGDADGPELLARASDAAHAAGDLERAVDLAIEAARRLLYRGGAAAAADLLERRLDGQPALPGALDREVRIALLGAVHMDPSLAGRIPETADDLLPTGAAPRTHGERVLLATSALTRCVTRTGTVDDTVPLARLAWGAGRLLEEEGPEGPTISYVTGVLAAGGRLAEDEAIADALLTAARARGSIVAAATASYVRAFPRLHRGDLGGALADAEAALEAPGGHAYVASAMLIATRARIELDDAAPAATMLARFDPDDPGVAPLLRSGWWSAVGRLRLAGGDAAGALEAAERMAALSGGLFLPYMLDHRLLAAEALIRLDRTAEAEAQVLEELAQQRAWGARGRIGATLVVLGMARDGDIALLREAEAELAASEDRLDHTAALVALGTALLADGSGDPEPALRAGLEQARAMGARRLERLARHALTAAGHPIAPPPISETLTPPERRVCELAALGLDDREVAQALFVSVSEVRGHLRTAFEKLGVDDRAALHSALRAA